MTRKLVHGTVSTHPRRVIHVVWVLDETLEFPEIDDITERTRTWLLSKYGEQHPIVVVVHGESREDFRLFGDLDAVNRVRAALFNAAVNWSPLMLY
jgi:hypothetical protein